MARRAGKNDGLKIVATALKREQNKLAKQAKPAPKKPAASATIRRTKSDSSSESDTDESMHNLEAPIPRKKAKKTSKFNAFDPHNIFDGIQEVNSFNEDEMATEGVLPPERHPGVTWYVRKHYMKEVVDVDSSSDERKMPAKISKKKDLNKKSIFAELMDIETDDEELSEKNANKATEEEKAFLKAISQEEKKAAKSAKTSEDQTN
jgi:hypothetical protein